MATEEPNKILVVDDSPQISKALSDLLSASGYVVRTAPSAERALQILESATFDLIITDLKMTGMTRHRSGQAGAAKDAGICRW